MVKLFKIETQKSPAEIITLIRNNAKKFDFIIRNVFDMSKEFSHHNIDVEPSFKYYSVMICNPDKAYKSINANKLRGAILLPPKQIVIFIDNSTNSTVIAYMVFDKTTIQELLPEDLKFQEGLESSCNKIMELIKAVV
ncbi:MAG: DUF302 domain-containing protein [Nanoarchaeota archaeon]|nr:DUF302 domain-containing protein [Nanoarchaeota archaeon]